MPGPDAKAPVTDPKSRAFLTLITSPSYIAGIVLLAHTLLRKHKSRHVLIVQYTSALSQECIDILHALLSYYADLRIQHVDPVPLPPSLTPIAKRFDDTLTKLRAFEPLPAEKGGARSDPGLGEVKPSLDQVPHEVCFLDADIAIYRNIDDVFDIPRPGPDWIAAHHACICNRDHDPWASPEWNPENCASSQFSHPQALSAPTPSSSKEGARPTFQLLNSGVFVCTPSNEIWDRIQTFLRTDKRVKDFAFPDQNFLDVFFTDHWVPIGWQYNALKTHRYWHAPMWRDDEVRALHYIVDKPWESKVEWRETPNGGEKAPIAGYRKRDGVTHSWWWKEFEEWELWMAERGAKHIVEGVEKYMCDDASKLGETRFKNDNEHD